PRARAGGPPGEPRGRALAGRTGGGGDPEPGRFRGRSTLRAPGGAIALPGPPRMARRPRRPRGPDRRACPGGGGTAAMTPRAMLTTRLAAVALLAASALGAGACRPKCCTRFTPQLAGAPANEVYQEFPSSGTAETAWRVRWAEGSGKGLYITGAWF